MVNHSPGNLVGLLGQIYGVFGDDSSPQLPSISSILKVWPICIGVGVECVNWIDNIWGG